MQPSLSVILPTCNAAENLGRVVGRLLDMLPDLAGSFEILIVDDASTDPTIEIADEWRRAYPQVRLIRHGWSWGRTAAVRTGRIEARGRHVIVVESLADFDPREIVRQWNSLCRPANSLPPMHAAKSAHGQRHMHRGPSFVRHLRQLTGAV